MHKTFIAGLSVLIPPIGSSYFFWRFRETPPIHQFVAATTLIKINPLCSGSGSESESLSCDIFIGFDGESEVTLAEEDFELSCGHESALWVVKKPATIHFSSCYSEGNAVMEKLAFSVDGSDHNHHVTPVIVGASPFRQEAAWGLIFVATMMMIFLISTHTFFGVVSVISIVDHFFGSENAIRTSVLHFIYWLFHAFVKPKGSIAIAAKNCIVDSRGPPPDGSAGGAAAPANKSCSSPSPIIPRSNSNGSTSPTPNANDLGARRASPENDTPTTVTPPSVASSRDTQAAPSTSSLSSEGVDTIHNTIETPSPVITRSNSTGSTISTPDDLGTSVIVMLKDHQETMNKVVVVEGSRRNDESFNGNG